MKLENLLRKMKVADQENGRETVRIPEILVERLKPFGLKRFIKVEPPILDEPQSGKKAIEKDFQNHPYLPDDPELQEWLLAGGNYGILAGEGIAFIESDNEQTTEKIESQSKTKFKVLSGSKRGFHYPIRTDTTENGVLNQNGCNLGNIQVKNKYIVGANSLHASGNRYEVIEASEIPWISKKELETIFGTELSWTGQRRQEIEEETKEETEQIGHQIPIDKVIDTTELKPIGHGELQGAHPTHGSETMQNFCVNTNKNVWHCFRCNSGGGPLMWLAVKHGILKCHEAQRGALKGEKFIQVLKLAQEEGFDVGLGDEDLEPDVTKYFETDKQGHTHFIPAFLADELMQDFTYATRIGDETIFIYNSTKGVYQGHGEAQIKKETRKRLGKHYGINRRKEVVDYIQAKTLHEIEDTPKELIAVQNGLLNINTMQLEPFTPKHFIFNALNAKYDPKADCPKIKKFLGEVIREQDIMVLQEFCGYILTKDCRYEKALLLLGGGANGKSTLIKLLIAFLTGENVANEPLHILITNHYAAASLYGKLANMYADLPTIALRDVGTFKMFVSGDRVRGETKYKKDFFFHPYAKFMFSANETPHAPEDTTAFYRRWIIITFPNEYLPEDPKTDPNLIDKLTTPEELNGLLNWTLQGLQRLQKQNRFTTGLTMEETRAKYIASSEPVKAFVEECILTEPENRIAKKELYRIFVEYCIKKKIPTVGRNTFQMKLPEYIPNISEGKTKDGKERAWINIKVADTADWFIKAKDTLDTLDTHSN